MDFQQCIKSWALIAGNIVIEFFGGITTNGAYRAALVATPYVSGTAIAIDASTGSAFSVAITDAVAFTIAAPTNPPGTKFTQALSLTLQNTSGGALGAGTFDPIFKMTSNTAPVIATGKNRTFQFFWNGTNWVETGATAADVAN